jgi:hypothetical protein
VLAAESGHPNHCGMRSASRSSRSCVIDPQANAPGV